MLLTDVVGKNHENSLWAKNPLANVVVMADDVTAAVMCAPRCFSPL